MRLRIVALLAFVIALACCQSAPYTGRSQLMILSESQESQLGLQAYQEVLGKERLSTNREWTAMVQRSGQRIAAVADKPEFEWEFKLIASNTVNAFCLPGGKVAFYEGIMPVCGDENGVAVVMGHEIAHAIARHGGERVSQGMLTQFGAEAASAMLGGNSPAVRQIITAGLGLGVTLPFSRKHESEADRIGLILMAKAGYDPRVAPGFWQRMNAKGGQRAPEFLSTHPSPETRIQQLEEWMPEAMGYYRQAGGR